MVPRGSRNAVTSTVPSGSDVGEKPEWCELYALTCARTWVDIFMALSATRAVYLTIWLSSDLGRAYFGGQFRLYSVVGDWYRATQAPSSQLREFLYRDFSVLSNSPFICRVFQVQDMAQSQVSLPPAPPAVEYLHDRERPLHCTSSQDANATVILRRCSRSANMRHVLKDCVVACMHFPCELHIHTCYT
ncbi:hypothetical protein BCR44DRAFT_1429522 [Catenaria anguillulae PL171]|uniref:Uncharacterized protein n=1 Tax=Catenaria anguillulae PL171 TaxID=765915 RepID=A0A1Y2HY73_9FUNG|nr:hypothetical protein BCR44DRAFT_1429522 [Catenaria anguillulae PL171]